MKTCLTHVFFGVVATAALSLQSCSSSTSPSGSGGGTGGLVQSSGGASSGGTTTSSFPSGGALSSGGSSANGGQSQGGSVAQGGTPSGGASVGGQPGSGGSASGGSPSGGNTAGGGNMGGSAAGGSATSGSKTGGSLTGGSATGGNLTGGNVMGGSKTDGGVGGVTATGGVPSGGVATGGKTATGGTGGSTSGGAVVTPATGTYPVSAGKPTIYIAGDSTVQTYAANPNNQEGWGQELANFFTTDVAIVNDSIGGRSSKSFIDEGRLTQILGVIKEGDYLLAQWGINDRYTSDATRYTNPATTFRTYMQQYVDGARGKNAIPVIITPTPRLDYQNGVFNNDYVAYCAGDAAVAASTNTPLIDLQTMALAYYTKLGITAVQTTIVLVENGQPNVLHYQKQGAYEMARLVALGIQALNLPISKFVIQAKLDGG
jgi:lysophospholipase L1-like esterase